MHMRFWMAGLVTAIAMQSPVHACKFARPNDPAAIKAAAIATVRSAKVIADMVVVRAYVSEEKPALLRAHRFYKGSSRQRLFRVGGQTSCHLQFREVGHAGRVLLFGGPRNFEAGMYMSSEEEISAALGLPVKRAR